MFSRVGAVGLACAASVALASAPRVARAAPDAPSAEDEALANALFEEGRRLMEEGRVPEACRKFEESERLDAGGGTLLNLAACHEREGRTASAWAEFGEALAQARRDGRQDRVTVASQRAAALESRLSRVTITVPAASDRSDLEVTLDGTPVRRAAWGLGVPVDPGEHAIEARAASARAWQTKVVVQGDARAEQVEVPPLEALPEAPAVPATPPVEGPPAPPPAPPAIEPRPPRVPLWRDAAMVGAGAVGVAGITLGTYFGLHAIALNRDAARGCPAGRCSQGAAATSDHAASSADGSTVAFAVGAAGVAGAVVLLLTRHASPVTVGVSADGRGATLGWHGAF